MSMLDYTPTGAFINAISGEGGDEEGDHGETAESCLERVDNLSGMKACCSSCGHGMADEDPVFNAGEACPLCDGTIMSGAETASQIQENAHEYWGE